MIHRFAIRLVAISLLLLPLMLVGCSEDKVFDRSPSERSAESVSALRRELVSAPRGWRVSYFPKADPQLFASLGQSLVSGYRDYYGVGGHTFYMKFDEAGTIEMLADQTSETALTLQTSEYEIKPNSYTTLSFTTYNYLHELVDDLFSGASDFLYMGKDWQGKLLFKTPTYAESGREYILFEPIGDGLTGQEAVERALAERQHYDQMQNPQLRIYRGDRIFFRSDVLVKHPHEIFKPWLSALPRRRYAAFVYDRNPEERIDDLIGLGSGYAGTEQGLAFYPGLRYSRDYVFRDFERVGDGYRCELVRVYDPIERRYHYQSRHLAPEGEPTGMIAEIWDER